VLQVLAVSTLSIAFLTCGVGGDNSNDPQHAPNAPNTPVQHASAPGGPYPQLDAYEPNDEYDTRYSLGTITGAPGECWVINGTVAEAITNGSSAGGNLDFFSLYIDPAIRDTVIELAFDIEAVDSDTFGIFGWSNPGAVFGGWWGEWLVGPSIPLGSASGTDFATMTRIYNGTNEALNDDILFYVEGFPFDPSYPNPIPYRITITVL
jgi:hypothetical protein